MGRKTIVLSIAAALLICAIGARIYYVNATATSIDVDHRPMGEWVDLDGAFIDKIGEKTYGYSIRVNSARLMSHNDYIAQYAKDKSKTVDGWDEKSVVCLEIEAKNVGNDEGAILLFDCKLIPARKNTYFMYARDLWVESEPTAEGSFHLRLARDSEYTTFVPYAINSSNDDKFLRPIADTRFELIVSNSPVRHVIDISL